VDKGIGIKRVALHTDQMPDLNNICKLPIEENKTGNDKQALINIVNDNILGKM